MRYAIALGLVALAGCSRAPDPTAADNDAASGPGIAVTTAPGVAFAYRYSFRLPSAQVSVLQEAHAQACESLGITRCRITGMRYQLIGENDIRAMLAFKLDPAIARTFGRTAIGKVTAAKGTLIDAEITGTDAGSEIDRLEDQRTKATDETRRIDTELAKPGRPGSERAALQQQRSLAAHDAGAASASAAEQRTSLASTPMILEYGSGAAIRGFDASAPLASAVDTGVASLQTTIAVLLGFIAIFVPPILALLLVWFAWQRLGAPIWRRLRESAAKPI